MKKHKFKKITSIQIALLTSLLAVFFSGNLSCLEAAELAGSRPNIIFVLTDDQGMGDLSCMGNKILRTPHLDSFYEKSTRFSDFHVSPTCAPTRAALMSGRRPFEVGVSHTIYLRERLSPDVITLPQALKTAGYTTAIFGKWHLGDEHEYLPQSRGFDEVLIHGAGGIGQTRWGDFPDNSYFDTILLHNDTVVKAKGYCTDVFFDAALGWMKKQHDAKKPYFTYLALNAPHTPMNAPEKYKTHFLDQGYDDKTAGRYGMIENLDENFDRMMKTLEKWNALENTLVIFMTDNGISMDDITKKGSEKRIKPWNAGLKGKKSKANEGGTRVPSFWYWKGKTQEGVDAKALTAHIDVYRTFCELAGANIPQGKLTAQGRSLVPLLEDPTVQWPDRMLFIHRARWGKEDGARDKAKYNHGAVRTPQWRLVYETGKKGSYKLNLIDITKDPGETTNLADQFPEVVQKLNAAYDKWWDSTEPLLINEGLEQPRRDQYPLALMYKEQLENGGIVEWKPDAF